MDETGSHMFICLLNSSLFSLLSLQVANPGVDESSLLTNGASVVNGKESNINKGSDSGSHGHFVERDANNSFVPFVGALGPPSAALRFSDPSIHIDHTSFDASGVLDGKGWENVVINDSNEEKITKAEVADTSRQVHSASILNKLFGNALTENGGTPSVEVSKLS